MGDAHGPIADIIQEAYRILENAEAEGIHLRLLGGLAIRLRCPGIEKDARFQRSYADLDFVTLTQWNGKTKALFARLGYSGNKSFNALHGYQRLLFYDEEHGRKIDIFIDRMYMCHTLDFRNRLSLDKYTLPISDLLMTKLQIVELTEKDILDTIALFNDYAVGKDDTGINTTYITGLVGQDWGLYRTFELNLKKIHDFAAEHAFSNQIVERIQTLIAAMESCPKSAKWKMRAMVGERMRWYEQPEETHK
jgi:hypothetical protein